MMRQVKPAFWSNFEIRERFDLLLNLRKELQEILNNPKVKQQMRNEGDIKSLELNVISESPDSEVATLLELLDTDLSDFFFGCRVNLTNDSDIKNKKQMLARSYQTPIKTWTYEPNKLKDLPVSLHSITIKLFKNPDI